MDPNLIWHTPESLLNFSLLSPSTLQVFQNYPQAFTIPSPINLLPFRPIDPCLDHTAHSAFSQIHSNVAVTNFFPITNSFVTTPIPTNVPASDCMETRTTTDSELDRPTRFQEGPTSRKKRRAPPPPAISPQPERIFTETGYKVKSRDTIADLPLDDEDRAMAELELGREMCLAVARGIDPTVLARKFFENLLKDPHFSVSCSTSLPSGSNPRPVLKIAPDLSAFLDGFTRLNLQKIGTEIINYRRHMRKELKSLPDFASMDRFVKWKLEKGRWIDPFGASQKEDSSNESCMIYRLRGKETRIFKEHCSSVKSESTALSSSHIAFNVLKKMTLWQMIRLQDVGIYLNDSHLLDTPNSEALAESIETLKKGFVWHGSMIRFAYRRQYRKLKKWIEIGLLPRSEIFRTKKILALK